ncbi:MAG: DUF2076 domain-containing protein [Selenomonas ruminantium]|uniref:DUF2076 domain-containing protein n=1 Tax=Selenomonas ruminantium TaxID=971 RepID=A0A927ZXF1_SELRU|nr:DUF2076 domain-containing protein [Selenomonas ruminantium]
MGTIALLGAGVFLGWVLFGRRDSRNGNRQQYAAGQEKLIPQEGKANEVRAGKAASHAAPSTSRVQEHNRNSNSQNHTLRNVAGGMVAGAVLGHMLSSDHKAEAHETVNHYNTYNEYYGQDDWDNEEYAADYGQDDYDYEDNSSDYEDYDSYEDNSYEDNSYEDDRYDYDSDSSYDSFDSGSDWGGDSYDGGDW